MTFYPFWHQVVKLTVLCYASNFACKVQVTHFRCTSQGYASVICVQRCDLGKLGPVKYAEIHCVSRSQVGLVVKCVRVTEPTQICNIIMSFHAYSFMSSYSSVAYITVVVLAPLSVVE